jgi:hypothetical protein
MRSKAGRVFGGFADQSWDSDSDDYKADENAFIFSIDRQQIYRPVASQKAIYSKSTWGPSFGCDALGLVGDELNAEDGGHCFTNGDHNGPIYRIKCDYQGIHEVTGEGKDQ